MITIIAISLSCGIGLFAGWLATKIHRAQDEASKKLNDEFFGLKEKSKYEKCWEEHEDHFHIYDPLTCKGCPHESRCGDSACGY